MILNKTGVHCHDGLMANDTINDIVREHVQDAVNNTNFLICKLFMDITNVIHSNPNTIPNPIYLPIG